MKKVQFSHLKYTGKNALNDRKKKFFSTVQLLRSKNGFSEGKAPEKINLRNNCHPNTYVTKFFSILAHYGIII